MTEDQIIEMAKKARMPYFYQTWEIANLDAVKQFAALVAFTEREACAKLCEQHGYDHYCEHITDKLSKRIKARGTHEQN